MLTKHVAEWLDECPVKWDDNDVIDGSLWIIVHNAIEPDEEEEDEDCLLYTSPSPRDLSTSRMPSSA